MPEASPKDTKAESGERLHGFDGEAEKDRSQNSETNRFSVADLPLFFLHKESKCCKILRNPSFSGTRMGNSECNCLYAKLLKFSHDDWH